MVGVAGKSKACHECKRRRLKCDLGRPGCLRCARSRITCPGYVRATVFINATPENPRIRAAGSLAKPKDTKGLRYEWLVEHIASEYSNLSAMRASERYNVADYRTRIFGILTETYLPAAEHLSEPDTSGAFAWVEAVCTCTEESDTLDASLLAFAATQLFVRRIGSVDLNEAIRVYSHGLNKLSSKLQLIESAESLSSVLASIVALSTCEYFVSPARTGWRAHVNGIAEIIRLQDFMGGEPPPGYVLLCARARIMSMLSSMMTEGTGKRIPALQWHKILRGRIEGDSLGDVLDVASEISSILELSASPDYQLISLIRAVEQLYDWEKSFISKSSAGPAYHFVPSHMQNPSDQDHDEKLFPLVLEFRTLPISTCLIVSWDVILHSLTLIIKIFRTIDHPQTTAQPDKQSLEGIWRFLDRKTFKNLDALSAIRVEANRRAQLLCQCVEYTFKPEMGCFGPQTMAYARWVLNRFFTQDERWRELSWCRNIANMVMDDGTIPAIRLSDFGVQ